jgi:hypothetical protein
MEDAVLPLLLRPPFDERLLLRPPPDDEAPPLRATAFLVLLLADARPLLEEVFAGADFLAVEPVERLLLLEAVLPVPLAEEDLPAAPVLEEVREVFLLAADVLPEADLEDDFEADLEDCLVADLEAFREAVPLEDPLLDPADDFPAVREVVALEPPEAFPPFLATFCLVVLLAEANPLFAEDLDAVPRDEVDFFGAAFLEAAFLGAAFLAAGLLAADFFAAAFLGAAFLAADLELLFEAVLDPVLLVDLEADFEPPRAEDFEAALLRPDDFLEAVLEDEVLPPPLLAAVFLEAVFLEDFAIINGF